MRKGVPDNKEFIDICNFIQLLSNSLNSVGDDVISCICFPFQVNRDINVFLPELHKDGFKKGRGHIVASASN